jgi:hypothetical protein
MSRGAFDDDDDDDDHEKSNISPPDSDPGHIIEPTLKNRRAPGRAVGDRKKKEYGHCIFLCSRSLCLPIQHTDIQYIMLVESTGLSS